MLTTNRVYPVEGGNEVESTDQHTTNSSTALPVPNENIIPFYHNDSMKTILQSVENPPKSPSTKEENLENKEEEAHLTVEVHDFSSAPVRNKVLLGRGLNKRNSRLIQVEELDVCLKSIKITQEVLPSIDTGFSIKIINEGNTTAKSPAESPFRKGSISRKVSFKRINDNNSSVDVDVDVQRTASGRLITVTKSARQAGISAKRLSFTSSEPSAAISSKLANFNRELYNHKEANEGDGINRICKSEESPPIICKNTVPRNSVTALFTYKLSDHPCLPAFADPIEFSLLSSLEHLIDGSNSSICKANLARNGRVIVKIVKRNLPHYEIAIQEYDAEHEILSRINHQHIVGYFGRGIIFDPVDPYPRHFLVMELLGGGSLMRALTEPLLFSKCLFSPLRILEIGKCLADAIDYLHSRFHPEAMIIHRDLKPDNICFTDRGVLKLMDFGLCICVKKRSSASETYAMTGNTGSLRYMAPEVVLCQPYTEKVDIYSYSIIMWQVVTGLNPFHGMKQSDFIERVVVSDERPPLTMTAEMAKHHVHFPPVLVELLRSCWAADQSLRLTSTEVFRQMSELYQSESKAKSKGCIQS